jgi:N-acetylmuramic acid 6-phosphate etherase
MKVNQTTEQVNNKSKGIDTKSTLDICKIINEEDKTVALAVSKALQPISLLIDEVVKSFKKGGRLIYIGAGTSGRLGVLDASECPPTFGVSPDMVVGIIAGGDTALRNAVENAEDNGEAGIQSLKDINFSKSDALVGITASGEAKFVKDAMAYAQSIGSVVGGISCNENSKVFDCADYKIYLPVGPEIVTGSTRMKSGTAQKMALNMITTVSMIKLGKVYDNYMVNLIPTNKKLVKRAKALIKTISDKDDKIVNKVWENCHGDTTIGILMAMRNISFEEAESLLEKSDNNLHKAIDIFETY